MTITPISENEYSIFHNSKSIGTVALSHNPHHQTNSYVRLKLNCFDPQLSKELFVKLKEVAGCPLQVMADSDNVVLTTFLTAGGCVCKRKCYESEVGTSVSVMTREKKPREEVNSKGILVDYILTNEKLLRYGKNNHFGMNDISTRVARGDERHIRVFAALSNDNT